MVHLSPHVLLLLFLLLGCVLGCNTESDDDGLPATETADCEDPISDQQPSDEAPVDFAPGIEDELAALDLDELPQEVDITSLIPLYRGFVAYALEIPPGELGETVERDAAADSGPLGRVVLGALLRGQNDASGIDFSFFRRGLQRYYTCSRGFPTTLEGFREAILDYEALDAQLIDSAPKCAPRRLLTSPPDGVFVAESVIGDEVRETEILLANRRDDGQLDFVVYDAEGALADRSLFPTITPDVHVVASAPYTCMTCHVDSEASDNTWGFNVLMPTGTGACAED